MHWTRGLRLCFIRASLARASDAHRWVNAHALTMVTKVNSWLKNVWELQNERAVRNSAALEQWLEFESGGSRLRLALSFSAFVSFAVGCLANIGAFLNSVGFFSLPPGASIRPMGWMAGQCLLAMVGLLFGTLPGILGLFGKRRGFAAVGALLGLAPYFVAEGILRWAMIAKGFHLSE